GLGGVVEAALSRARVRPAVVAVWAVLAGLVLVIVALELRDAGRAPAGAAADLRLLVPVPVDELGAIEIAEAGRLHRFERDAVGSLAPDTVSRYVMVVGRPLVVTIPGYQIDNLLALVQAAGATSASTAPPGGSR